MKKFFSVLLALILVCCSLPLAAAQDAGELAFRADGTFRILQLSDTQDDAYPAWDMLELVRRSIEFSDPDLVVISGDLVEDSRIGDAGIDKQPGREGVNVENIKGELNAEKTRANVETAIEAIFSEIEKYEVPYVIALGNNDRKVGLTGADWLEIFSKYSHCIAFDESEDAQDGVDYHVTRISSVSGSWIPAAAVSPTNRWTGTARRPRRSPRRTAAFPCPRSRSSISRSPRSATSSSPAK